MVGAFDENCERAPPIVGGPRTVLAESLVVVDIAVLPRGGSCSGENMPRPLGTSSDRRPPSVDCQLGLGDGWVTGRSISVLSLLRSMEGLDVGSSRKRLPELDGRVGGEGGA